jgi:polar amino acid transport system substrate-binding protein
MKTMTFLTRTAVAFGALALAAGAAQAQENAYERIMESGKIRVATDMGIPPSGMLDENLEPTGSDVETAKLLAEDWGLELEFIETTGATRIPNLQTNKADIVISTLSVTPERDEVIDFSTPYAALESVIGAPADADISGWEDVKGKSVTVTRGTTQDADLTALAEEKGFEVVRYKDDATMVTAALSGQAEMVATSATVVNEIGERNEDLAFEPKFVIKTFDLAIGTRQDEPVLLEKLNEWVTANLKNGKLNEIYQKYHGASLPEDMLQ